MNEMLEKYYEDFGRKKPEVVVDDISVLTEAEWLKYRQTGIGGSDAGTIFYGENLFSSVQDVAEQKVNEVKVEEKEPDDQFRLDFGHAMESVIAAWYEKTHDDVVNVFSDRGMYRSKDHPCMIADTDALAYLVNGKIRGLEFKTTSIYNKRKWKSGTFGVDAEIGVDAYVIQVFHYMYVMDLDEYDLIVAFGNNANDIVVIHFERDDDFINSIIELEEDFWSRKEEIALEQPNRCKSEEEAKRFSERLKKEGVKIDNPTLLSVSKEIVDLQNQKADLKEKIDTIDSVITAKKILAMTAVEEGTSYCGDYVLNLKMKKRKGTYDPKVLDKHEKELSEMGIERRPGTEKLELTVEEKYSK